MSANSFGQILKITTFGESHGPALGVVIDGCPSGVEFSHDLLTANLERRKPGQSSVTTARQEADQAEVLSGVFENKTLGTPICIIVKNQDADSKAYEAIKSQPRIGHADDTWKLKFGHVDHRGGGRSSGRETLCRVIAGSVAQMICEKLRPEIKVRGYAKQIANFILTPEESENVWHTNIDNFKTRFPSQRENEVVALLEKAKAEGESFGGVIEVKINNITAGLGQPVFHKFKADLGFAMMSLGAVSAFEIGEGFASSQKQGTEFHSHLSGAQYGGIRGGITTGETIDFRVGFKPTSSIKDLAKKGRHDPCIVPRAVPVVEAMTWILIADHLLWTRLDRI
ncbi:MAG: chorismate synthase [Bdellovibrionaceae bacterium]|nr:chorismate synthase [Bdellovibrio sp.]